MVDKAATDLRALAEKGDGVLVRRGGVWTYPGAPFDPSGTNLRLPLEYVSDAVVQEAIADGTLQAATYGVAGDVPAVRIVDKDGPVMVVPVALAGSPDAATELPPNSRPTHDAGAVQPTPQEAAALAERHIAARDAQQQRETEARAAQNRGETSKGNQKAKGTDQKK